MGDISRRSFVAASTATVFAGLSVGRAVGAEFNYKLANDLPAADPMNTRFATAIEAIERESGGRLAIRLFPASQLGSISEELSQVRSGALEFYCCGYGNQVPVAPLAGMHSIAFAWSGYERAWPQMDGELGGFIAGQVARTGTILHVAKPFDVGFRQITSGNRPIRTPEDLRGFKIRVPPAPILATLFSSLGASPTSITVGELYQALQTGLVDGSENPLWYLNSARIHEVQRHITITNHSWDAFVPIANRRAWARLPENIQQIVTARFNEAALGQRGDVVRLEAEAERALAANGVTIHRPQAGIFREALARTDYYRTWRGRFGEEGWTALQRATGVSFE
jgi:tripartite ATP-independent transporter DctP family solute receptor